MGSFNEHIFCVKNDAIARRSLAITLARNGEVPIGLEDKVLCQLATFDMDTGLIVMNKDNAIRDVCSLKTIYEDVRSELKQYEKK